jgi:hypothetical protein
MTMMHSLAVQSHTVQSHTLHSGSGGEVDSAAAFGVFRRFHIANLGSFLWFCHVGSLSLVGFTSIRLNKKTALRD